MSAHHDVSTSGYANLSQDTQVSKGLAASRWAPGATDEQKTMAEPPVNVTVPTYKASKETTNSLANSRWAADAIDDQKMGSQQMTNVKIPTDKASKPTTNGLLKSRWATDTAEPHRIRNRRGAKVQQKKGPNSMLKQPCQDSHDHKTHSSTNQTNATTHRIIGPLSEEEKTVKMENPFFNPEKHKGLSSSRWAD